MKQVLSLVLVGLTALGSQSRETNRMLLDSKLPSVYIQYERQGTRRPIHSGESEEGVWLRIHNNTIGAIRLCTETIYIGPNTLPLKLSSGDNVLALKDGVEASVCYSVEAPENKRSVSTPESPIIGQWNPYHQLSAGYHGDFVANSWVPSGGSILLSLPKEHLAVENRIRVDFSYEWEIQKPSNVVHAVYFYAVDIKKG